MALRFGKVKVIETWTRELLRIGGDGTISGVGGGDGLCPHGDCRVLGSQFARATKGEAEPPHREAELLLRGARLEERVEADWADKAHHLTAYFLIVKIHSIKVTILIIFKHTVHQC